MAINILDGLSKEDLEIFDELSWNSHFESNKKDDYIVYDFNIGDKIRVFFKTLESEGNKTLEGICTEIYKDGIDSTFTIKKEVINYIGKPKIFKLYLDSIQSIEVIEKNKLSLYSSHYKHKGRAKKEFNHSRRKEILEKVFKRKKIR